MWCLNGYNKLGLAVIGKFNTKVTQVTQCLNGLNTLGLVVIKMFNMIAVNLIESNTDASQIAQGFADHLAGNIYDLAFTVKLKTGFMNYYEQ